MYCTLQSLTDYMPEVNKVNELEPSEEMCMSNSQEADKPETCDRETFQEDSHIETIEETIEEDEFIGLIMEEKSSNVKVVDFSEF